MKPYSDHEINKAVHDIATLIEKGDSIILARKKVCGNRNAMKCKMVVKTEMYLRVLNGYLRKVDAGYQFERINGKLVHVK